MFAKMAEQVISLQEWRSIFLKISSSLSKAETLAEFIPKD
jgi:hypothetical protein